MKPRSRAVRTGDRKVVAKLRSRHPHVHDGERVGTVRVPAVPDRSLAMTGAGEASCGSFTGRPAGRAAEAA